MFILRFNSILQSNLDGKARETECKAHTTLTELSMACLSLELMKPRDATRNELAWKQTYKLTVNYNIFHFSCGFAYACMRVCLDVLVRNECLCPDAIISAIIKDARHFIFIHLIRLNVRFFAPYPYLFTIINQMKSHHCVIKTCERESVRVRVYKGTQVTNKN